MSEGKIRGKILVDLWAAENPLTLQIISEKAGLSPSSTMGYLLGLIKAEYVCVPEKHQYTITILGKQALGLPKTDKALAEKILCSVTKENAFHFYNGVDKPLNVSAFSLKDFLDKIQTIDIQSIEFHMNSKDFECWINSTLCDVELSKKVALLRGTNVSGEELRNKLYQTVKSRYNELVNLEA
ncbi:MAG: hypothetical protein IAX21_10335 [Candidatus Bathyarchaeota archaeon]|nr:MAG: hypothetical protein NUK63_07340 [Candidatus Bathyarchaeum tardum]WNZ29019.1 MAG: hypothetical protein IAX21_10335 [Candidatus Bathyarchaeota archaeon]